MNRETKIGLVTGLTLIVLIGALLSSYLSRSPGAIDVAANNGLGRSLRSGLLNPAGIAVVPSPAPSPPSPVVIRLPIRGFTTPQLRQAPRLTAASTQTATAAVTSVMMPPILAHNTGVSDSRMPSGYSSQRLAVSADNPQLSNRPVFPPTRPVSGGGTPYTIKRGDTLDRIAWRFYHDAGPAAVERIVQANRGKLAGAHSVIWSGETLLIPVPIASGIHAAQGTVTFRARAVRGIHHRISVSVPPAIVLAPRSAAGAVIYRVRRGDTLFGIARRFLGAGSPANIHKLMTANHLRRAGKIYVGMILHIARR